MEIRDTEPSASINGEGAARAKAIARRRIAYAIVARVLPWLRLVNLEFGPVSKK